MMYRLINDLLGRPWDERHFVVEQISNLSVSGEIVASRANFPAPEPAGLPLPSTGRGNEGEGWCDRSSPGFRSAATFPPLTPSLSPLRGEGASNAAARHSVWLRLRRAVLHRRLLIGRG